MSVALKFLRAEGAWAAAIMLLLVPIALTTEDPLRATQYLRWLAHSLALAALPAGIISAKHVFVDDVRRNLIHVSIAIVGVATVVFILIGFIAPATEGASILDVLANRSADSRTRNFQLFLVGMTIAETLSTMLFAGIGLQLAYWKLPRPVFWAVAFAVFMVSYAIPEILWEQVIVRIETPVPPLALLQLLLPAGIFAGLTLPTAAAMARR